MAAIDSLLKLIVNRNGQSLELASGEVPRLTRAGVPGPLAMPQLDGSLVEGFVVELLGEEALQTLQRSGELGTEYSTPDGLRFEVRVRSERAGYRLFLEPGFAAEPPTPEPAAPLAVEQLPRPPASAPPAPATPEVPSGPPVAVTLGALPAELSRALEELDRLDGSDLILASDAPAHLRLPRGLRRLAAPCPDAAQLLGLFAAAMHQAHHSALSVTGSCDFALQWPVLDTSRRYRVNLFRHTRGLSAVLRPVRTRVPTLEELRLPLDLQELVAYPNGLVLFTGASGSGKSTTLVALIEALNTQSERHIITLEDPIEYLYPARRALIHQREVGRDVESFSSGLRAALRENPDVILLGEMRDRDTISAALTAAETGHLVLSTLHAGNAATAIDRMIDSFPSDQQEQARFQLAGVLRAVVTQQLLPARQGKPWVPALEKVVVTHAVASLIRDNRSHLIVNQVQTGRAEGMRPLERSLEELRQRGLID